MLFNKSPRFMAVLKTIIEDLRSEKEEMYGKVRDVCNKHYVRGYEMYFLEQRVSELEEENKRLLIQIADRERSVEVTQMTLEFTVECLEDQISNLRM